MVQKFNFIPFSDQILEYAWDKIPSHGDINEQLKSGEIHLTITARTPIYIGAKNNSEEFFQNADGEYTIPGSSLRGLLYTNMQILGYGALREAVRFKQYTLDGRPKEHKKLKAGCYMDFPYAMMGFIEKVEKENGKNNGKGKRKSYITKCRKSRISVGDCVSENANIMSVYHAVPKAPDIPNAAEIYSTEGNYEEGFRWCGYKMYWLRENADLPRNERGHTAFRPLNKGTEFHGVIYYKNLHAEELGLLLWAVCLDRDCFHSIGFGKEYGMGRIVISVDKLVEYDYKEMYSIDGFFKTPQAADKDNIKKYIDAYDALAAEKLTNGGENSLRNMPEIQDFLFMRSCLLSDDENQMPHDYMNVGEYREQVEEDIDTTPADEESLSSLLAKFNGGIKAKSDKKRKK